MHKPFYPVKFMITVGVSVLLGLQALNVAAAETNMEEKLTHQGNLARVTVGTIKTKATLCNGDMAASIGEMLSTALSQVDNLIVLASMEEVGELADELNMANSGFVEEGSGPEAGLMEGADIMITGAVTSFEPDAGGKSGALSGLKKGLLGKVGLDSKKSAIGMDIKLIDIRTRRIIKAIPIKAESSSVGVNVGASKWGRDVDLGGSLGGYKNTPMEDAIRELLTDAVDEINKQIPKNYYRYKGKGQYTQDFHD